MVISRTPFRISLFGGGTDFPVWYKEHSGAVISTTIDKYCYVTARYLVPIFDARYRIRYTSREEVDHIDQIRHPSVRECLKFLDIEEGIEIQHNTDLSSGIGMGSSSSFTVGLLNALYALNGKMISKHQLALDAIHVEADLIGESVGDQDQTAASYGGFNYIQFGGNQRISVQPMTIGIENIRFLESHLMLFFTGFTRDSAELSKALIEETPNKVQELSSLSEIRDEALQILNSSLIDISRLGVLLDESWRVKSSLTKKITNKRIDDLYELARNSGALGGKITGAGGGGCMLFLVRPYDRDRVRNALKSIVEIPFQFEYEGSKIIYSA